MLCTTGSNGSNTLYNAFANTLTGTNIKLKTNNANFNAGINNLTATFTTGVNISARICLNAANVLFNCAIELCI